MLRKFIVSVVIAAVCSLAVSAQQKPEVSFTLNEAFFDGLLDSMYQNFEPPEFSLATTNFGLPGLDSSIESVTGGPSYSDPSACAETVKILRETRGIKTAVRFRDGKIFVPLAFSGTYSPPLVGCVEFGGTADAEVELVYGQDSGKLSGRVKVNAVNLNGTGGIGGSLIARMLQSSIDKRMNPIDILGLDKVSFGVPIHKSGTLRMVAKRIRTEIVPGALNVRVEYEFAKG